MLAGLTQHQLLVFPAVMRKTYGFNKKTGLGEQRATFRIDRDIAAQVFCCKKRSGKSVGFLFRAGGISALIMWSVNGQHYPNQVRKIKFT